MAVTLVFPFETGAPSLSAQDLMRSKRPQRERRGAPGKQRQCYDEASLKLCRLPLPVKTQILTKASLFGGFSLRKFRVKIAQKGLKSS